MNEKAQSLYVSIATATGKISDLKTQIGLEILTDLLVNKEASPLKTQFLQSKMGNEFSAFFDEVYNSVFFLYAVDTPANKTKKLYKIYQNTLKKIVQNGFERKFLLSVLKHHEFSTTENQIQAKRGISYVIEGTLRNLYNYDAREIFQKRQFIAEIKKQATQEQYFEKLIKNYLLDAKNAVVYQLQPSKEYFQKQARQEKKELDEFQKSLSPEHLQGLIQQNQDIVKRKNSSEKQENLEKIPKISLSKLNVKIEHPVCEGEEIENNMFLFTEGHTKDIIYINIGFKLHDVPMEYVPYINTFAGILCEIGTKKKSYHALENEIYQYTGGVSYHVKIHQKWQNMGISPVLWIKTKVMKSNLKECLSILEEMLLHLDLSNHKRINEIILRNFAYEQESIQSDGYSIAVDCIEQSCSTYGLYKESLDGYTSYMALKDMQENFPKNPQPYLDKLQHLYKKIIQQDNLTFHTTSESGDFDMISSQLEDLAKNLSTRLGLDNQEERSQEHSHIFIPPGRHTAFIISSQVSYVGLGGKLFEGPQNYNPHYEIIKQYLDREYFYNKIRVLGGAYGNFSMMNPINGTMIFISYRDPNIDKTYGVYQSIPQIIKKFSLSNREFEKFQINSYSKLNPLLNPQQKGLQALNNYMSSFKEENFQENLEKILTAKPKDIPKYADQYENLINRSIISTIGNKEKILQAKSHFYIVREF